MKEKETLKGKALVAEANIVLRKLSTAIAEAKGTIMGTDGMTLEEMERYHISRTLHQHDMNQSTTAQQLGISRTTLWRRVKELGIKIE